ncbi:MAG: sugar ABC transporter permease [Spirochaetales bacterium]|nr:sugar ABC transporter permease [Spirochaetales bacterium]
MVNGLASRKKRAALITGLVMISPWLVNMLLMIVYPTLYNLGIGMTHYSGMGTPKWIGFDNYTFMFKDKLYGKSLYNTIYYTLLAVPIGVCTAMLLALAMNRKLKEIALYRAILALPSVLPLFALALVFMWVMNPRYGILNIMLGLAGIHVDWLGDPRWAKFSLVLLSQLGAGQYGLIFLAAMRGISPDLYDAASIDGANGIQKFWRITFPMMTPIILYDVIVGVGFGLQVFMQAYIMTQGGPANATMFNALYIYNNAFRYGSSIGYAAAMSNVLFFINVVVAVVIFKTSKYWVYEETNG